MLKPNVGNGCRTHPMLRNWPAAKPPAVCRRREPRRVGRRPAQPAEGTRRGTGLQRGGLRALASRRSEQRGAAEPAAHVEVLRRGISSGFNSYGIARCCTAASSQVKQKQWWSTPLLKMLEMKSVVTRPLLLGVMIKRDC